MITIICGTNRANSISKVVSLYYQQLLTKYNKESVILDLHGLPADFTHTALYNNSGKNQAFNEFRKVIEEGSKFVFVVPEYNGSFPGVLKAFIDGLKYPSTLANKKGALVGLSSGVQGGDAALSHLSDVLSYLGMNLVGLRVKLSQIEANLVNQKITNPIYNQLLDIQIQRLID
jgi:NAD(P)H-dependent FMN reductase